MHLNYLRNFCLIFLCFLTLTSYSQFRAKEVNWDPKGNFIYEIKNGNIVRSDIVTGTGTIILESKKLIPVGKNMPLTFNIFSFSSDEKKLLLFTNTAKVWRYHTRGDYWIYNFSNNTLFQLGKGRPAQSLMFAKLSPDGTKAAYVSEHNIFVEDLNSHLIRQLTHDGSRKLINGTFDWVYEEELGCRDGFRWSMDSRKIAFWQVDARKIRDYYMLNTTDSVYSHTIPVEYPKVGQSPSPVKIGVINIANANIKWMAIPGDPQEHYLPRMEWANNSDELVVQQLNRKQNESKLYYCNALTGNANNFFTENDKAWIDIKSVWNDDDPTGWEWINNGKEFLWVSEKDGWRHIYKTSRDGKHSTLLTIGNFDANGIKCIDEVHQMVYFMASPSNATEIYLYRTSLDGKGKPEMVSPENLKGTHDYNISPNGSFAFHNFSNFNTFPISEWISLPDNLPLDAGKSITKNRAVNIDQHVEYFTITTSDNINVDGWLIKPKNFDPSKKYPVLFYVYGEPAATTTQNSYGGQNPFLFNGDLSGEGYFYVSLDNRGTPALKGSEWRKAIYKNIGRLNIHDQAMAAKAFLQKPYFDTGRVAVWGWSGGGSSTLNLMFQYPEIYKTGISVSAVDNLLFYDNIYEERYMGLPQEDIEPYLKGSPIYYAKNLSGKLLFIHGTGDDNVHYDNAEAMLNELIKYNKQFQFMPYPNRTHEISEGEGTFLHLKNLFTTFLRNNCPGGGR